MSQARPTIIQQENMWVLRIPRPNGKMQEYRCNSESQARQLALMLARPIEAPAPQPRA